MNKETVMITQEYFPHSKLLEMVMDSLNKVSLTEEEYIDVEGKMRDHLDTN
jgi:hypothetical protein